MKNYKLFIFLTIFISTSLSLVGQPGDTSFYYAFDERIEINPTGRFYVLTNREINRDTLETLLGRFEGRITFVDSFALRLRDTFILDSIRRFIAIRGVFPEYLTPDSVAIAIRNEAVVRFRPGVSTDAIAQYLEQRNVRVLQQRDRRYLLAPSASANSIQLANTIYESGLVIYAHPNFHTDIQLLRYIPNDQHFERQFYLHNTGQLIHDGHMGANDADIDAPEVWDITRGNNTITVAVIDEGVTNNHPDLPGTRQIRLNGSNFASLVGSGVANDPEPVGDGNHGNACAGVIAATQDNNEGISGIAPNINIMPIRMQFGMGGNSLADFSDAIALATNNNADVISNSWGNNSNNPNFFPDFVTEVTNATTLGRGGLGAVVTIAAGNTANQVSANTGFVSFPGNINVNGVLTVGASERNDLQANYSPTSNLASPNNQIVDITAPSHRAYSSQIAGESFEVWSIDIPGNAGYNDNPTSSEVLPNAGTNFLSYTGRFGGTSAATPQVAAVAALVLSIDPGLTQQEVFNILTCAAEDVGGYAYTGGFSNQLGNGRLNAFRSVMLACPASYNIDWLLAQFTNIEYAAGNFITAENLIETNTNVQYHADNFVELLPGFETTFGAIFTTTIEACSNCDNIIAPTNIIIPSEVSIGQKAYENHFKEITITNKETEDFSIFPNPSAGIFSISIMNKALESFSLSIFDINGKELMTVKNPQLIDISEEPAGIYFFRFSYADQVVTKKIVVNRH